MQPGTGVGSQRGQRPWAGLVLLGCSLWLATPGWGAADYLGHGALTAQLKQLAAEYPDLVRVTKPGMSVGSREVWLVEVGTGSESERKRHPALLVVAGIEGDDLAGTASAVQWVANLARRYGQEEAIRSLLETTVLYVFPRLNPDAGESYFNRPRLERTTNATPADDDHDGAVDEDGPEDLNGDGLVTWMRVQDPEGEYILNPADSRLLIKADKSKGEKGAWRLLPEGTDDDKDDQWNEDGLGGVNLNRNFPYNYQYFAPNAGWHPVSEPESRALADFVVAHPNIGIAFTFGAADNLVQTPKSEPGGKRPPKAISEADAPYYRELGQLYRDVLGLKKELTGTSEAGTFSDWIYFHRGCLALAARPWTPQLQIELGKAQKGDGDKKGEPAKAGDAKPPDPGGKDRAAETDSKPDSSGKEKAQDDKGPAKDKRSEDELAALKWFDENAPEGFVGWQSFNHPDFPNQKVEVGGWAPFARSNPPVKLLDDWCQRQGKFLTELAGKLPRIGLRKAEVKHLGSGVFELTLQVENTGYLPTALAQGALSREVLRTRVALKLDSNRFLSGQKTTLLAPIAGSGGMEELRYIIRGGGPLELEVTSALGGTVRRTIELKEAP